MKAYREITLKDGRRCILRSGRPEDAEQVLDMLLQTRRETDFLMTYPDEMDPQIERERSWIADKEASEKEVCIVAEADGRIVGSAGIDGRGHWEKLRHRAEFGIGILREYWGLGIGSAMLEDCVECARKAGYTQLELAVVAENLAAWRLYQKAGFRAYGRNPRGFLSRSGAYQELVLMCLELEQPDN